MFAEFAQAKNKEFRFRGKEPGRLENFSDSCFALAVTLLLISTSPPSNFEQIQRFVWELIPFAICIVFIILIWYEHFLFFYRYGLRTPKVIVWNSIFLVIVLFYVYPLKFLARLFLIPVSMMFGASELRADMISTIKGSDIAELMIIYGLGASAVFLVIMFMYRVALASAAELQLNEREIFDTKASIRTNLLMAVIPVISALFAVIFSDNPTMAGIMAGFSYFLYTPVMWWNGSRNQRLREKLLEGYFSSASSNAGEPI